MTAKQKDLQMKGLERERKRRRIEYTPDYLLSFRWRCTITPAFIQQLAEIKDDDAGHLDHELYV